MCSAHFVVQYKRCGGCMPPCQGGRPFNPLLNHSWGLDWLSRKAVVPCCSSQGSTEGVGGWPVLSGVLTCFPPICYRAGTDVALSPTLDVYQTPLPASHSAQHSTAAVTNPSERKPSPIVNCKMLVES